MSEELTLTLTLTQRILARATELVKIEGAWIRDEFFASLLCVGRHLPREF